MDGGAVAAGQVVSHHGDEVVLATLQVEHQDVLHLLLPTVQFGRRRAVHKNLKLNVHGTIYELRNAHVVSRMWRRRHCKGKNL